MESGAETKANARNGSCVRSMKSPGGFSDCSPRETFSRLRGSLKLVQEVPELLPRDLAVRLRETISHVPADLIWKPRAG